MGYVCEYGGCTSPASRAVDDLVWASNPDNTNGWVTTYLCEPHLPAFLTDEDPVLLNVILRQVRPTPSPAEPGHTTTER